MPPPHDVPDAHRGIQAAVIRFAVRFRGVVVALAFALLGYGVSPLPRANLDVFPEFSPSQVVIQTEAPGLAGRRSSCR